MRQVVSKYYSLEPGKYRSIFVESDGCMQVRYFCGFHYLAEDYYKFEELRLGIASGIYIIPVLAVCILVAPVG